jgi:hypothetical protein
VAPDSAEVQYFSERRAYGSGIFDVRRPDSVRYIRTRSDIKVRALHRNPGVRPIRRRPTFSIVRSQCRPMCVRMTVSESIALPRALCAFAPLVPDVRNVRSTASPASGTASCSNSSSRRLSSLFWSTVGLPGSAARCLREVTINGFEQPSLRQIDQASRTAQVMLTGPGLHAA